MFYIKTFLGLSTIVNIIKIIIIFYHINLFVLKICILIFSKCVYKCTFFVLSLSGNVDPLFIPGDRLVRQYKSSCISSRVNLSLHELAQLVIIRQIIITSFGIVEGDTSTPPSSLQPSPPSSLPLPSTFPLPLSQYLNF